MKRINTIFLFCFLSGLFLFNIKSHAQVTVQAKLDSAGIFIGQRMGMTVEVSANAKDFVEMPHFDSLQQIVPGVEYVNSEKVDTQYVNDNKRVILTQKHYITSFDTALYLLPPVQAIVGGKTFSSGKMALKVITFEIDTVHVDSIFGNKPEMAPDFLWDEWKPLVWLSLFSLLLIGVLVYVSIRLKNNKPIIRRIKLKKHIAPHKVAMQKIEEIKEDKVLWQSEDSKEYYTQLTDTLRQYIKERYGFNATEMTSFEIIQKLEEVNNPEAISELRELFQTADLVKFAKYSTMINENDRNLVSAIEYINQTKVEEPEQKAQPEEIVVEEKRSKITKISLIGSICLAAGVLLAVVCYIVYRVYMNTL